MASVSSLYTQCLKSYSCVVLSPHLSRYPVMRSLVWFSVAVIENKTERSYGGMVYCITRSDHSQSWKLGQEIQQEKKQEALRKKAH